MDRRHRRSICCSNHAGGSFVARDPSDMTRHLVGAVRRACQLDHLQLSGREASVLMTPWAIGSMTAFRTLDQADVKGKRVLLRVDLNVPMQNGEVTDATRIERMAPTITEIADKGGKVILLSHFGRPKGPDPKESLQPVAAETRAHHRAAGRLRGRLHRREAEAAVAGDEAGRHPLPGEHPLPRRRGEERPGLRRPRSPGSATSGSTTPSRSRIARMPRPKASATCCRPMRAAPCRRSSTRSAGRWSAAASARRHRRRRQGLDQARPARQPHRQGRRADHRRRHGQHVPGRAGQGGRQVAVRARPRRHRARHPGQGQGRAAARSCCRSMPSWRASSRPMRPRASSPVDAGRRPTR